MIVFRCIQIAFYGHQKNPWRLQRPWGCAPNPFSLFFADEVGKKQRNKHSREPVASDPPAGGDVATVMQKNLTL